jgi:hypothetical protein
LHEYTFGKQTANELAIKYGRSRKWILEQIGKADTVVDVVDPKSCRLIVVVADAAFYSWADGHIIFREPNLKKNLIWKEIHTESPGAYAHLKAVLELRGYVIKAVILDGKRGIREVFRDIPVQMCQFHQIAIVRRRLTGHPKLEAAKELYSVAMRLTKCDEDVFTKLLNDWHTRWTDFLKERTIDPMTKKWFYTHKRLRQAYSSLKNGLPYLFTYLKYPELNLPNTTNSLDGYITTLKTFLRIHRGISREKRNRLVDQILAK